MPVHLHRPGPYDAHGAADSAGFCKPSRLNPHTQSYMWSQRQVRALLWHRKRMTARSQCCTYQTTALLRA